MAISNWLNANKLVVSIEKTLKITISSSASSLPKEPQVNRNSGISCYPACKYLGITSDCKLSFPKTYGICDWETRKTKLFDNQTSTLCTTKNLVKG